MEETEAATKKDPKNPWVISLVILLIIGLFIQAFYIFHLRKNISNVPEKPKQFATNPEPDFFNSRTTKQWHPFFEMDQMHRDINRLFRESFGRRNLNLLGDDNFSYFDQIFEPDLDIEEKENHYLIKIDLPGMDKDKIEINIENGYINIKGNREIEQKQQNDQDGYYRFERSFGAFSRTIPVPGKIKEDAVTADYKKGVLTLSLPKAEQSEQKSKNQIKIV